MALAPWALRGESNDSSVSSTGPDADKIRAFLQATAEGYKARIHPHHSGVTPVTSFVTPP